MEAEVARPLIMADVNGNNKMTNAELEVLKLQELVRKLERQNEQLRTRANAVNHCTLGPPQLQTSDCTSALCLRGGTVCPGETLFQNVDISSPSKTPLCTATPRGSSDEPIAYFQPSSTSPPGAAEDDNEPTTVLDEVEVLDLGCALPIEEQDRWLYASPKERLNGDSALSPLQWCRQVLDHPGPEVQLARMMLCHRLDQGLSHMHPQSSLDSEVGVSELEDDSISMSYKLQDMTDVEVMARLQEESLRQDYASTSSTTSRRSSTFSIHSLRRSEMDLEEEDEEDEGYDQLPPPQPRLFRTGSMQRAGLPHSHTFSSIRDCRRSSSQFSLNGLSQFSGPSSLTTESPTVIPCLQSFDSCSGLARLQSSIPPPGQLSQRVQSVGNFPSMPRHPLKATAYVSPTIHSSSLVPLSLKTSANHPPRSSLPRPASFVGTSLRTSKISQPTRSLLTPPKSIAALSALRDGSWKDGCY
uniref:Uncharacterized protein n=1 Tax=Periophthalmus magnuspinnatus TaxID=409849 RepID=A0A3B4ANN9_9GOBI